MDLRPYCLCRIHCVAAADVVTVASTDSTKWEQQCEELLFRPVLRILWLRLDTAIGTALSRTLITAD